MVPVVITPYQVSSLFWINNKFYHCSCHFISLLILVVNWGQFSLLIHGEIWSFCHLFYFNKTKYIIDIYRHGERKKTNPYPSKIFSRPPLAPLFPNISGKTNSECNTMNSGKIDQFKISNNKFINKTITEYIPFCK